MKVETKAHRPARVRGGDTITGNITVVMNPRTDGLISERVARLTPNERELLDSSARCPSCCHLEVLHHMGGCCRVLDCDCEPVTVASFENARVRRERRRSGRRGAAT